MQTLERICITCKAVKPFTDFHKNKLTKEGVTNKCKVCKNEASRIRYEKNGAKMREQMAAQRKEKYKHRIEIERASRSRRKEFQRPLKNARQQIRNRLLEGKTFTLKSREIAKLYEKPCYNCGTLENLSIDHIVPLARGGSHSIGNLMTLCRKCNASKGKKLLIQWKMYLKKVGN